MTALRLRPGLHYAPVDGGVYFAGARAAFVMNGPPALFKVIDACLPLLECGTDVEELVTALGRPAARPVVEALVETLSARDLLLHPDQLTGPEPSAEDRDRYPEALAYLETHRDQPYADFLRIRRSTVGLVGPVEPMGPAVRGLLRSGVGRIVVATSEPSRLASLAARHAEIILAGAEEQLIADVAVIFSADGFPLASPPGSIVVPVRVGKDLAIVGPAVTGGVTATTVERLWERAGNWWRLDHRDLLVRPSGDLLAGALAAHVAFEALCGRDGGQAHVVHGPDLVSEAIAPHRAQPGWIESLSQPWSGLFRLSVPGELPQMPLALTIAEGRSRSFEGRVVGFGSNQQESTAEAALAALRGDCGPGRAGQSTPAAGVDEARWLLDGALRILAGLAAPVEALGWSTLSDGRSRRLAQALEDQEQAPVRLLSQRVPGFGWVLVSVHDRRDGSVLARGWGPTPDAAAVTALSGALARQQARRTVGPGCQGSGPGLLGHMPAEHLEDLSRQVREWLGASGHRLRGRRLLADPVAGPLPVWTGTVGLDG